LNTTYKHTNMYRWADALGCMHREESREQRADSR
jgi:hypothetical protein